MEKSPMNEKELRVLGKKWTWIALKMIVRSPGVSFNRLKRLIKGVSAKVLSQGLEKLGEAGLVRKRFQKKETGYQSAYIATERGEAWYKALQTLESRNWEKKLKKLE